MQRLLKLTSRPTVALLLAVLLGSSLLSGCGRAANTSGDSASTEATAGTFPATTPSPSKPPPPPMLRDSRTAVNSYLLWISYAYRVLNSDVASQAFDPYEEVRVNSYVEYNRQLGRAIDQRLLVANIKSSESVGDTATLSMHEEWAYRYIDTKTGKYKTPTANVAYETTYTVVRNQGEWRVHSVEASSSGAPVQ